tara:strand:- start:1151 stop:1387 length:237 start_codon:yes stop_codon:yes gene_type:complete
MEYALPHHRAPVHPLSQQQRIHFSRLHICFPTKKNAGVVCNTRVMPWVTTTRGSMRKYVRLAHIVAFTIGRMNMIWMG